MHSPQRRQHLALPALHPWRDPSSVAGASPPVDRWSGRKRGNDTIRKPHVHLAACAGNLTYKMHMTAWVQHLLGKEAAFVSACLVYAWIMHVCMQPMRTISWTTCRSVASCSGVYDRNPSRDSSALAVPPLISTAAIVMEPHSMICRSQPSPDGEGQARWKKGNRNMWMVCAHTEHAAVPSLVMQG